MELMKGYKQSVLGVVPEDWTVGKIKELCSITTGTKNTQDKIDEGQYPFFVRSQNVERINSYSFDGEAILTAGDGVGTGKIFHYINGRFDYHQRVYMLSDFSSRVNAYFLFLYFSNNFFNRISQMTAKSSVDSIRMEMIADMEILIPPKSEQTAIAQALSDADAYITSLEKLIEKKQAIKQGTMQELLKPKDVWKEKYLHELVNFHKGKGLPKSDIIENGLFKCIHYGELFTVYKESISTIISTTNNNQNRFLSKSNDILMPTSDVTPNGLAKACCIKEDNIILGGDILVIRPIENVLDGVFLSYYITANKSSVLKLVSGSTVYHLYASDMKHFNIFYPELNEQIRIATILTEMEDEVIILENRLSKAKLIKQGMMQQLLTGKIRLK